MDSFILNKKIHNDTANLKKSPTDVVKTLTNDRLIYIGKVIDITDDLESMRIKVRIPEFDNNLNNDKLPYCYPMNSQFIKILPKIGESVLVILSNTNKPHNDRIWLTTIIRTYEDISKDVTTEGNAYIGVEGYYENKLKSFAPFKSKPNTNGVLANNEDISIEGRKNSNLILGDNKLTLRCRYKNDDLTLNAKNPSYILLNYNKQTKETTNVIRADKVLLLSHDGFPNFKTIMDDNDLEKAYKKCHSLPYGDVLVSVLKLFATAITSHYHPFPTEPPVREDYINSIKEFNYDSILSKNIKIN